MFRKILVGYDGSESSENAFEKAIELAQKFQSKIPEYIQTIDEVEEAKTQAKKFYKKQRKK
ncbi:MAG: universal stress protein [Candidatus Hydrothermia bacterium]|jgi:nucleotide-binding universal stress UspA family protein